MRAKTISLCDERQGSLVKRLRLRPLTPATRVRFPHESPKGKKAERLLNTKRIVGVDDAEGPPVPIPNTEVKLSGAENTWLVTAREDRRCQHKPSPPQGVFFLYLPSPGRASECLLLRLLWGDPREGSKNNSFAFSSFFSYFS